MRPKGKSHFPYVFFFSFCRHHQTRLWTAWKRIMTNAGPHIMRLNVSYFIFFSNFAFSLKKVQPIRFEIFQEGDVIKSIIGSCNWVALYRPMEPVRKSVTVDVWALLTSMDNQKVAFYQRPVNMFKCCRRNKPNGKQILCHLVTSGITFHSFVFIGFVFLFV